MDDSWTSGEAYEGYMGRWSRLVAAEAKEESRDMLARVLAVLRVTAVHARNLETAFQSAAHTSTGAKLKNGSGVNVADVEVSHYIMGCEVKKSRGLAFEFYSMRCFRCSSASQFVSRVILACLQNLLCVGQSSF